MAKKIAIRLDTKTRRAGITALFTSAALALFIILNVVFSEFTLQIDLTPRKLFSLTEESRTLLDELDRNVDIIALYEPGNEPDSIMDTLGEYERHSPSVSLQVLDPVRNPGQISQYSQDQDILPGSLIVRSGDSFRIIANSDLYEFSYNQQGQPQFTGQKIEQQVTSAIAYVTTGYTPEIYEITGHGETTLGDLGYQPVLQQSNYVLNQINLLQSDIPDNAALVTLVGPRNDISPAEADKIEAYLNRGGAVLVALDPVLESLDTVYQLLARWDVEVVNGLVFENEKSRLLSQFAENPTIFVPVLSEHETLAPLKDARLEPIFQTALGLKETEARQNRLEYETILSSSENSWLRTDLDSPDISSPGIIPGDTPGPVDLVVAIREKNQDTGAVEGTSLVVLGSSQTLGGIPLLGQIKPNADLALSLVQWAVGERASVSVATKNLFRLPLRINGPVAILYSILVIIVIPLACMVSFWVIHVRRRNK